MIMVRAIVRPEKIDEVLSALMYAGFPAVTKMDVFGRGKQRGMKIGEITYDEVPKELIFTVIKDEDKDFVTDRRHVRGPGNPSLPAPQPRIARLLRLSP